MTINDLINKPSSKTCPNFIELIDSASRTRIADYKLSHLPKRYFDREIASQEVQGDFYIVEI